MLFGGDVVDKDHIRIEAYGAVDELNAFVGHLIDHISEPGKLDLHILDTLGLCQQTLFSIGTLLATTNTASNTLVSFDDAPIKALEGQIDLIEGMVPTLKNFILPTGHPLVSLSHVCRTICRRVERRVVSLSRESAVDPVILVFLNRFSDYLFMLARLFAVLHQVEEVKWVPRSD